MGEEGRREGRREGRERERERAMVNGLQNDGCPFTYCSVLMMSWSSVITFALKGTYTYTHRHTL